MIGEPGLGVHVDIDAIRIEEVAGEPGDALRGEHLYVLEGELVLAVGDREQRAPAGSWVERPPGLSRGEPVRYLAITTATGA